jgi:dihydropteroate synthase-like protein
MADEQREHILFLTGKLAEKQLRQTLEAMQPDFTYTVYNLGLSVAALMTAEMIRRRLKETFGADRILVPGRCTGDLEALSRELGIPVERGPNEIKDLPAFFGKERTAPDLSRYDIRIFAEITDAPRLSVEQILAQADRYRRHGADVIDIGFLPGVEFPHLEEALQALKAQGYLVSVDSLNPDDLLRGGKAGADYLLSLQLDTLWIAQEVASTPILVPSPPQDLASLDQAAERLAKLNLAYILDPILEPIHFGFTASIVRYYETRRRHPQAEMMMGVGNLTELTHADTAGINALLLGICSELEIRNILTTQVSPHCRRAVPEADLARRILFYARAHNMLPKHIHPGLMSLHEPRPFSYNLDEVKELASMIRDPSFRIQITEEGIHIFNRTGLHTAQDPFELFPHLGVEHDGGHAFYLGAELTKAQIAWQLGKRYTQDEPLDWGCAVDKSETETDLHAYKPAGTTLKKPAK